jgi:hypothetical protein
LCENYSGEDSRRSKRSALLNTQLETAVDRVLEKYGAQTKSRVNHLAFALWHRPLQSLDDLFGDFTGGAVFGVDRLAKVGIVVRFYAFDYSTRDPLRPGPFDFSPAFHKALFYGRQTGFQTKHPKLGVERLDSCNDFIEIVAAAESHRDDDRP